MVNYILFSQMVQGATMFLQSKFRFLKGVCSTLTASASQGQAYSHKSGRRRPNQKRRVSAKHSLGIPSYLSCCAHHSPLSHSPTYLPPGWVCAVHPEGNSYFFRAEPPLLRVVTGCNINDSATAERVSAWVEYIQALALEKGIIFTEYMELFIQLDATDCQYYLADDDTLSVFWLENYESDDLGLLPVVSRSHMILQLQLQYWAYRESFPHTGMRVEQIEELIQVFAHGLAGDVSCL